ncbi:hypothetical protein JGS22_007925 [Streptomyces sp. P38-E01]|uniref:DUF7224 domain-containing protein n=1 Tax=Streptomyces tardus TaxID=2780544 RepID=A0A949JCW6_9ACTN|nr:hypothetical protein [Streptomyces tardus]MBU7597551.1 hypothetical protein [Streptomyces tardus]
MNLSRSLKTSPVRWLALPVLAVALFYLTTGMRSLEVGYGGYAVYGATRALAITTGTLAALSAWEAGRLRAGQVWRRTSARGRITVAFGALRPVLLLTAVVDVTALSLAAVHAGAVPHFADLPMILALGVVQIAFLVVGFGVGCVVPRALAAPLVLIAVTLWLVLPPTLETPWVRYLTGVPTDAPTLTDTWDPAVLLAPPLLAAGAALAVVALAVAGRSRLLRVGIAATVLVGAAVPAQALVADAGYEAPTVPRTSAQTCSGEAPRICVPGELSGSLPTLRAAAEQTLPALAQAGIETPTSIENASVDAELGERAWRIHLDPPVTRQRAINAIATALIPRAPECTDLPDGFGVPSSGPLRIWLLRAAGVSEERAARSGSAQARQTAAEVRTTSREDQLRWVRGQMELLSSCDPEVLTEAAR